MVAEVGALGGGKGGKGSRGLYVILFRLKRKQKTFSNLTVGRAAGVAPAVAN